MQVNRLRRKISTADSKSDAVVHARNIFQSLQKIVQLMTDIGPREEIGDLTLSMAALERILVVYFQGMLLQRPGFQLEAFHFGAVLDDLEQSIDLIERDSQLHKPRGGMLTLLSLTNLELAELCDTLEGFKIGFFPAMISSPLFWAYSFLRFADLNIINDSLMRSRTVQVSNNYSNDVIPLVEPRDLPFYSSIFGRFDGSKYLVITGLSIAAGALSSYNFRQVYYRNWLKTHRERVSTLMRQWTLALYTVVYSQLQVTGSSSSSSLSRVPSQALLVAQHNADDAAHATEVLARRVLYNSPPPSSLAWWFDRHLSLFIFKRAIDVFYASTGSSYQWISWVFGNDSAVWRTFGLMFATWFVPYYAINLTSASYKAAEMLANPTMDYLDQAWKVLEMKPFVGISLFLAKLSGKLGHSERLMIENVPCMIISHSKTINSDGLIFFCHGGGFFKHMPISDLDYLLIWSRVTGYPVLIPEYTLVPQAAYPVAINELFAVYRNVSSSSSGLGFKPKRICVAGDSAGGNLAASLINRILMTNLSEYRTLVQENEFYGPVPQHGLMQDDEFPIISDEMSVPIPTCLFLAYPGLNLCISPSPSRSVLVADPVLPIGITTLVAKSYSGPSIDNTSEYPCLSPAHTPKDLMRHYPRTMLVVGSYDPLLDDAEDFYERLKRNSLNETLLEVYEEYPHGYLGLHKLLVNGSKVMESHASWICESMK